MAWEILQGDCIELARQLPDACLDAIVSDPPAGIDFLHKDWDCFRRRHNPNDAGRDNAFGRTSLTAPHSYGESDRDNFVAFMTEVGKEALRTLKPGGFLIFWAIPRTSHWTAWALEEAGFEVKHVISHLRGCLSEDTELLLDGKWVPYGQIEEGRSALCFDPEKRTFSWQPVQEVLVYDYHDTAFRLRGDYTDQLVSREHRCIVERGRDYVFQVAETLQPEVCVPVLENVPGLLQALPLPHRFPGPQQESLCSVQGVAVGPEQEGEVSGSPSKVSAVRENVSAKVQHRHEQSQALLPSVRQQGDLERAWFSGEDAGETPQGGPGELVGGEPRRLCRQDERPEQPRVEGRGDMLQEPWELQGREVCSVPVGVRPHGEEGRVCDGAQAHSGEATIPVSVALGSRSSLQPRPHGQSTGEPGVVLQQQGPQEVRVDGFTRTDLVTVEPVEYVGKVWCVRVPTGAFVARRNGHVFVTGNSGFPKGLNIGKAMDRMRDDDIYHVTKFIAAARDAAGKTNMEIDEHFGYHGMAGHWTSSKSQPAVPTWENWLKLKAFLGFDDSLDEEVQTLNGRKGKPGDAWYERPVIGWETDGVQGHVFSAAGANPTYKAEFAVTGPVSDEAHAWDGWNTALRPNSEHWIVCQKPLGGRNYASNILQYGVGGLNVKGCGVPRGDGEDFGWPSNILVSHHPNCAEECVEGCPALELDRQSGTLTSGMMKAGTKQNATTWCINSPSPEVKKDTFGDSGGASRYYNQFHYGPEDLPSFIYMPGATRAEKEAGCAEAGIAPRVLNRVNSGGLENDERWSPRIVYNDHPTVKSISLMRWLCRLVVPKGATIADFFCGSGTTACAAVLEGMNFIGFDLDARNVAISSARASHWSHLTEEAGEGGLPPLCLRSAAPAVSSRQKAKRPAPALSFEGLFDEEEG